MSAMGHLPFAIPSHFFLCLSCRGKTWQWTTSGPLLQNFYTSCLFECTYFTCIDLSLFHLCSGTGCPTSASSNKILKAARRAIWSIAFENRLEKSVTRQLKQLCKLFSTKRGQRLVCLVYMRMEYQQQTFSGKSEVRTLPLSMNEIPCVTLKALPSILF